LPTVDPSSIDSDKQLRIEINIKLSGNTPKNLKEMAHLAMKYRTDPFLWRIMSSLLGRSKAAGKVVTSAAWICQDDEEGCVVCLNTETGDLVLVSCVA
jgi:hypothetical protein